MSFLTMKDGARLFYRDSGKGPTIVFSHGWPLNSDEWDSQILWLSLSGYRVIAYDRRGYGRSTHLDHEANIDVYADDLAFLIQTLSLIDVVLVGQGAGGCEIARFVYRYGTQRVSRIVLISAAVPGILKTTKCPSGFGLDYFNGMRHQITTRRAEFMWELASSSFAVNLTSRPSMAGLVNFFCVAAMAASLKTLHDGIHAFYETDFTEDLKTFDVPTLLIHGADDPFVPVHASTSIAATLIRNSTKKIYSGSPHGLSLLLAEQISADIYAFLAD